MIGYVSSENLLIWTSQSMSSAILREVVLIMATGRKISCAIILELSGVKIRETYNTKSSTVMTAVGARFSREGQQVFFFFSSQPVDVLLMSFIFLDDMQQRGGCRDQ